MSPLICGKKAKEYVKQREADFPMGLKGQPSYLTDKIAGPIYVATDLGKIVTGIPLPRPRPDTPKRWRRTRALSPHDLEAQHIARRQSCAHGRRSACRRAGISILAIGSVASTIKRRTGRQLLQPLFHLQHRQRAASSPRHVDDRASANDDAPSRRRRASSLRRPLRCRHGSRSCRSVRPAILRRIAPAREGSAKLRSRPSSGSRSCPRALAPGVRSWRRRWDAACACALSAGSSVSGPAPTVER